ncbi:unnamed protein product [Rhizophagus irregularis]|nr:unnamed protein product [Rhizophagus irregularis]
MSPRFCAFSSQPAKISPEVNSKEADGSSGPLDSSVSYGFRFVSSSMDEFGSVSSLMNEFGFVSLSC